ncbi:MAG: SAM-dependent methyltransferase [Armatimonadota bacterium]
MTTDEPADVGASFRDPSGFVFKRGGVVLRQINECYRDDWDHLVSSGLYEQLSSDGRLVPHEDLDVDEALTDSAYHVIRPQQIPFISYPYEWSFGQLKAAALLTLEIQREALEHDMSLKDATAFNVQFIGCRPVFIDTLSFERYREGEPWVGYRQFCEHFIAPLALMAYTDCSLGALQRLWIDGIPLPVATSMLPWRTRLKPSLLTHLHIHAGTQKRHENDATPTEQRKGSFSRLAMTGLMDSLEGAVSKLDWTPAGTEWAEYYDETNYSDEAMSHKKQLVARFIDEVAPATVWDIGANTGEFSLIARDAGATVVAMDVDRAAVDRLYRRGAEADESDILPLVMDLTNPSPALGWNHDERSSLKDRGPSEMALALALVHHLAIGNNVPLPMVADFLHDLCDTLVVEFVPKTDSQVQRMLASREDIFDGYHQQGFEDAFAGCFEIADRVAVEGSERTLYLMRKRATNA